MEILVKNEKELLIIAIIGKVTFEDTASLRDEFRKYVAMRPARMIVNLAEVTSIDASGLGLLIAAQSSTGHAGISFSLCGLNKLVERTFHQTNLTSYFTIHPTEELAIGDYHA